MLPQAFVATADFRSLTQTQDFHYVVGRRGTGKTALFRKVAEYYGREDKAVVIAETPPEHHAIQLQNLLATAGLDYRLLRGVSRLVWKTDLLIEALTHIKTHYKFGRTTSFSYLSAYATSHRRFLTEHGIQRALALLDHAKLFRPRRAN